MLSQAHRSPVHARILPPVCDEPESEPLSRQVLDQLQVGIAVLGEGGALLFCNCHARRLTEIRDAVAIDARRRLYLLDGEAQRKFQDVLRRFARAGAIEVECDGTILANRPRHPEHPLIVSLRPLSTPRRDVLATFSDLGRQVPEAGMRRLMQSFSLTPAEQRLTHYLTAGGRLGEAAAAFGVSRHTVRNQLRSVFDKVGVQRQADLTRLMLAGSGY
jgi:DNA-binding CsgD family transcriptional regulator